MLLSFKNYILCFRPSSFDIASAERSDVERNFATNAFSFFVGWQWVTLSRDCIASLGLSIQAGVAAYKV